MLVNYYTYSSISPGILQHYSREYYRYLCLEVLQFYREDQESISYLPTMLKTDISLSQHEASTCDRVQLTICRLSFSGNVMVRLRDRASSQHIRGCLGVREVWDDAPTRSVIVTCLKLGRGLLFRTSSSSDLHTHSATIVRGRGREIILGV